MGVIQSLRSQATAVRAQEDTKLQVSGYLGTVNKSLGSQIDQLIDGLQGAINERTKAYNGITYKLTQQVSGKGGIGEQSIQLAFQFVKLIQAIASLTSRKSAGNANDNEQSTNKEAENNKKQGSKEEDIVKNYTTIYDYISYPLYKSLNGALYNILTPGTSAQSAADSSAEASQSSRVVQIVTTLLDTLTKLTSSLALAYTIDNLKYDYQRMTTQLGFTNFLANINGNNISDQGASKLLAMRDSMMMRYKIRDTATVLPASLDNKGYVGSLERRF
jgi:hypothetical protein